MLITHIYASGLTGYSHVIHAVLLKGAPWFVLTDICGALDVPDSRKALKWIEDSETALVPVHLSGGLTEHKVVINAYAVFDLQQAHRNRLPVSTTADAEIKRFLLWFLDTVLPSHDAAVSAGLRDALLLGAEH